MASSGEQDGRSLGRLDKAWRLGGRPNLALHLAILGRLVDRCMVRQLSEYGINIAQWRAIALLSLSRQATFGELAGYGWHDRGDLSRALARLEEMGLASRTPNPADRRSFLFALTESGRTTYDGFSKEWRAFESECDRLFPAGDLATINRGLEQLAGHCLDHMERD